MRQHKEYIPAQDEPEVVERIKETIAHGYIAVCNCADCQRMPTFVNAPLQDLIQLQDKEESSGKSERGKR